jgi:hypothetical protein
MSGRTIGQNVDQYLSAAKGIAKTMADPARGLPPEKSVDLGPGPEPKSLTAKPPSNYYKGYGAYAPRYSGKKVSKRKGKGTRRKQ